MKSYIVVLILSAWLSEAAQELLVFEAPATYDVTTTVQLSEVERRERDVSYQLRSRLGVRAAWASADRQEYLLRFDLSEVQLFGRGSHAKAEWQARAAPSDAWRGAFYATWRRGRVRARLPRAAAPHLRNYQRALLSLFQFQTTEGEYNETDATGACRVDYETLSDLEFRKIKRECHWEAEDVEEDYPEELEARRVTRYTLAGGLAGAYAEEVLELRAPAAALKARSWLRLERRAEPPAPPAPAPAASLAAALAALPADIVELELPLQPVPDDDDDEDDDDDDEEADGDFEQRWEEALALGAAAEAAGGGGGGGAALAGAALRVLPALRRAPAARLRALLEPLAGDAARLTAALRLTGLAGTGAALAAADALLALRSEPAPALAAAALHALALAPRPAPDAVRALLALGGAGGAGGAARQVRVAEAALLAAAAAAARARGPGADALAGAARDALAAGLARCKDDDCRAVRLLALGNLRRADSAELLLEHAERGAAPAALAALHALGAVLPALPAAARDAAVRRLLRAATAHAPRALAVRAEAVLLAAALAAPRAEPLARAAHALHGRAGADAAELRRVLTQSLAQLGDEHEAVRALAPRLAPELRTWDARAAAGTSAVLARAAGWAAGGARARLHSAQVAARGVLRRGRVALLLRDAAGADHPALAVELWTTGLAALAGAAADGDDEEAAGGGLALTVAGVRLPDVPLFSGQAELLGHVWAGTGSAATPVLRAVLAGAARRRAALQAGAVLRLRSARAAALALDAQAQASLWARTARGALALRAGVVLRAALRVRGPGAVLRAAARAASEPRLRVAADLDFYDDVALCVRARLDDHDWRRNATLASTLGARRWAVRRRRGARAAHAGRTLALGARNDAACRALPADEPA